jgi:poly-gamma-glutamate capsule biosynthesis protein CapA/YwtB (metallophosphatase superfamily)
MKRRNFLLGSGLALLPLTSTRSRAMTEDKSAGAIRLFLAGDVMTGRGIDQILPHPADPRIYESYLKSARDYAALSEQRFGPLTLPVDYAYPWGDALAEIERQAVDFRIINLETAITSRGEPWPNKGIHYRMHPDNLPCLEAARPDCCVLANNHVLDWGYDGLGDTLGALSQAAIHTAGAGKNDKAADRPAVLKQNGKRLLVFAWGMESSGVPAEWAAGPARAGVSFLEDLSAASVQHIAGMVQAEKRPGDVVVASLHWGSNWG